MSVVTRVKRISLTTWVFLALVLGVAAGALLGDLMVPLGLIGDLWLNLIKLITVPLILTMIIRSITVQNGGGGLGRTAGVTFAYFVVTTIIAAIIGSVLALVLAPGEGFAFHMGGSTKAPEGVSVTAFFQNLVSDNMIGSFADGNLLQVLVIAVLLGIAIRRIPDGAVRERIDTALDALTQIVFSYIRMVIAISPIGVFFLMASTLGKYGSEILGSFSQLLGVFYIGVLLQIVLVYGLTVWVSARVNPLSFLRRSSPLWLFTISTASSAAAVPVNLRVAEERFGVAERVRNFVIPLGSQVNNDGNAMLLPAMVVFTSQAVGMHLSFLQLVQIVLLGTLLAVGGGGIPGSGVVKVLVVLGTFGLPLEIGGIAAGFYRLFDMGITSANCLGDLAGSVMIDRWTRRRRKSAERVAPPESVDEARDGVAVAREPS